MKLMMSGILTKCEVCKKELDGIMIFYPTLCLQCVVELDINDKEKLKKYKEKT